MEKKLKEAYQQLGFNVEEVKGNSRHGEHMVAYNYDGVQYTLDHHGKEKKNQPDIKHGVVHLQLILKYHHEKIKKIYDYLMKKEIGDIWVMSGGGMQLQAFFGNSKGYIAILYFHLDNEKPKKKDVSILQIQGKYLDKYFDNFSLDGVSVQTHKSTYGKDEEEDEDYDFIYSSKSVKHRP